MGLIDDKRDIFIQIGALTSIKDNIGVPSPQTDSLLSINNKKEVVPFLLDLLTALIGSETLENTIGELLGNTVDTIEPILKTELKTQVLGFNSNDGLPTSFINNGYELDISHIDIYDKLRVDPTSQNGSLLYGGTTDSFNNKAYEAVINEDTDVVFNNIIMHYNSAVNKLIIKPTTNNITIGDFFISYIDNIQLINKKELISKILNLIFGTLDKNQNKSFKKYLSEEKISKTLDKLISENEDLTINDNEIAELETIVRNKIRGINYIDIGCGVIQSELSLDEIEDLVNSIGDSSDPLAIGNAFTSTLNNSFNTGSEQLGQENIKTIKDGFLKRLINAIVKSLVESIVLTPQIRTLFAISSAFRNNDIPEIGNPIDDLKNKRNLVDCLSKKTKGLINEFLFNLIKKELLKLVIPISKKILVEKINQYLGIIKSLVGLNIEA